MLRWRCSESLSATATTTIAAAIGFVEGIFEGSIFEVEGELDAACGGGGDGSAEAGEWGGAGAVCGVEERDVGVIEEVEGLGDDVEVAAPEEHHLEDAKVEVDVG